MTESKTFIFSGETRIPLVASSARWLVVEKPCGVSIHNDPDHDLCSLVLAAAREGRLPGVDQGLPGIHAVHRLDRDTSGIVLLAGDTQTLSYFSGQFADKSVRKQYLAVCHGAIEPPAPGIVWRAWNCPLTPGAAGRNDPVGRGKKVACTTRLRLLARTPHYSLIECEPLTGRKHQIRRHAKIAGHPVVGDRRYGSGRALAYLRQHCGFDRLGLHAHALSIRIPEGEKLTTFTSGGLPEAMRQLLETDKG